METLIKDHFAVEDVQHEREVSLDYEEKNAVRYIIHCWVHPQSTEEKDRTICTPIKERTWTLFNGDE